MLYRLTIYLFVQKNMFVQPANESPLTASDRQANLAEWSVHGHRGRDYSYCITISAKT